MVGVGIARISAKAARRASTMLRVRIVFPAAILQRMVLRRGADFRIADAAILFRCVLRVVVLIILCTGAVTAVLILAATAAIIASAVAPVLAGRVVFPIAIAVAAVGRTPINGFSAIAANLFPVTAIPRCICIVMLAGGIFLIAAFRANTPRVEAMGFGVAVSVLVCRAVRAALPRIML